MAFLLKMGNRLSLGNHSLLLNSTGTGKFKLSRTLNGKRLFSKTENLNELSSSQLQPKISSEKESNGDVKELNYKVGDVLSGFKVKEVERIPEFSMVAVKLVHEKSKAEYFHFDRDDFCNAFSVMFRTTPKDSTGLPHILEHTTLCGSKKFPCRDPFFKMINRSLALYMNALTGADWTMYPFLTQNDKDFKNLMAVYLDAVFQPLLKETDFKQEGWRLEYTDPQDQNSPIIIKGVVFNEMKGHFSDNQTLFQEALLNNILPSHTYSVCSGGDPICIPNLTYNDLLNFHNNYYSPLNAKYFSYGNLPLSDHLEFINNEYLNNMNLSQKGTVSTMVPPEKRWSEPVRKHIKCRNDPLAANKEKQSTIAVSQMCCSITDIEECFILKVISELLTSGPNSSFYKTLIEPNIGSNFSPATGFEGDTRDTFFTIGLQGVSPEDFPKVEKIYEETIDDIIENGFDHNHFESVMHTMELGIKHQVPRFGLLMLMYVTSISNHGGNVIDHLKIESKIKKLRDLMREDPKFLQKKVKQYFKDNQHKLVLTMSPDPNYDEERKEMEERVLKDKLKNLDEAMKKRIYEDGLKLLEEQKQKDDKSCLPTLSMNDLKKDVVPDEYQPTMVNHGPYFIIPQPTNGIVYFKAVLDTTNMPVEESELLPLFAHVSTKMGTYKRDYKEFDQLVSLKTGGLSISCNYTSHTKEFDKIEEGLILGSYCLEKNTRAMFNLWSELLNEMKLVDLNRMETLVKAQAAGLVNGIPRMAHSYATSAAASLVSSDGQLKETRGGITYVNTMKSIAQMPMEEVLRRLRNIRNSIIFESRMRLASVVPEGTEKSLASDAEKFLKEITTKVKDNIEFKELSMVENEFGGIHHVLPLQVSSAAKALVGVPYEHEDFPALTVLSNLLGWKYLLPEIREKGGAYGCGLNIRLSGQLVFFSFSDPNPVNSLKVFDNSVSWLKEKNFTDEDLDEAKLGVFQSVDAPISPESKGMRKFLFGITDEAIRNHRLRLMNVTADDIVRVGAKYLDDESNGGRVGRAVVGPENKSIVENSSVKWDVRSH